VFGVVHFVVIKYGEIHITWNPNWLKELFLVIRPQQA